VEYPQHDISGLSSPAAYPHDPSASDRIEVVQTHISVVFLTPERAYKFRKPVDLGFLDFSTLAERNADCLREIRLNRRLAPDVYLGVAPLKHEGNRVWVGEVGESIDVGEPGGEDVEHCVVMRRLPAGRDALSLLAEGALGAEAIDRIARTIARFHGEHRLGSPAPFRRDEWHRRIREPVTANFAVLEAAAATLDADNTLHDAKARMVTAFHDRTDRFDARRTSGLAVDGHGDLHLQHIWLETADAQPLIIDCVEFSEALRRIDAASDVAFLAMDLGYRGRPDLAARTLRVYAAETDDFDLYSVVDYFIGYRASVRAKVAAIAAADTRIGGEQRAAASESARRHLEFVVSALGRPKAAALLLTCGVVGSGKSTVAEAVADELQAVSISSDRVRKRLAGSGSDMGAPRADESRYGLANRERVYDEMLRRAAPVVESGRTAILDATFSHRRWREAAREWARRRAIPVFLIETRAPADTIRQRLRRREDAGHSISDAGPDVYPISLAEFEPTVEWPSAARFVVETGSTDWRRSVVAAAAAISTQTAAA
jgi:aminoglycoside phosphotransferase family enzyme/predicted kinase